MRGPHTGPAPETGMAPETGTTPDAGSAAGRGLAPEVVRRALEGQPDAWETLVGHYQGYLYRVARSFRLDKPTCDDVVQTTWLRLLEHASTVRDPGRVGAWLVTTLRRHIFSVLRSHGPGFAPAGLGVMDLPDPGRSPEQEVTASDRAARISVALRRLPAPDRELLALLMDSSWSYRAVSAELNLPVGSIGPKRARSLERLHRELDTVGVDRELISV
ncbi:MAG: RNA polymerase sigma factor [Streptosporangiaceae bacterium]